MPRLRAVWATIQACLALATIGWGAYALLTTHEALWGFGNFSAAVFLIVTSILFAANHEDGRIVGLFGLVVFLAVNGLLAFQVADGALPRLELATGWTTAQLAALVGAVMALVGIPQAMLLAFGHGPPPGPQPLEQVAEE